MKKLLLVDDNDKYAKILTEEFAPQGYEIERAWSAAEGLQAMEKRGVDFFDVILTDITMETQLAGIHMLGKFKKMGYRGTVIVASTGFDFFGVVTLSRICLGSYGVHYLVPKTTVLKRELVYYPLSLFSPPVRQFKEILP